MKKLLILPILFAPMSAWAVISGPTASSNGQFTLTWASGSILREVSSSGAVLDTWTGTSAHIHKSSSGTYYFQETWCGTIPFAGYVCYPTDAHEVYVSNGNGASYPQSLRDQGSYEYRLRSGDFDSNGRTDVLVERLAAGPADGSMQSYIVWNNTNGTISTTSLNGSPWASIARNAPINNTLNLLQTDINADGFVDHMIERVNQVMGSNLQQQLAVFAPGADTDKTRPQGNRQVDANFRTFFVDLARMDEQRDLFLAEYLHHPHSDTVGGLYLHGWLLVFEHIGLSGRVASASRSHTSPAIGRLRYGVNFSALSASSYMDRISEEGGAPALNDLWQISQIAQRDTWCAPVRV